MITTLSVDNYRSVFDLAIPLESLNVVTGPNGSGKSNLYKSLRLLAETARGGVISSLAKEGGLDSTFWAGPESFSRGMKNGTSPVQGTRRKHVRRLRLGFASDDFGYAIMLGLPEPTSSAFALDPEIKQETIWAGNAYRPASALVERIGAIVKVRSHRKWKVVRSDVSRFDSIFDQFLDPNEAIEIIRLRERIRSWRFYDHFRTDKDAPARAAQIGTRTPVLNHDGSDLAAAIQTIREIGDRDALDDAIAYAFPGARVSVTQFEDGRFSLEFHQHGLLRPLSAFELSDGTLRYILLIAALLTPRPPSLMVLNEPETSLHPDLLPSLAKLIIDASKRTQVWVVSHSNRLVSALNANEGCHSIELEKEMDQTKLVGYSMLDTPLWHWPDKRN